MLSSWISLSSALLLLAPVQGGGASQTQFNPVGSNMFSGFVPRKMEHSSNTTRMIKDIHAPTPEQREEERQARRERQRARNARVKEAVKYMQPDQATTQKVSKEELEAMGEDHPALRRLWGGGSDKSVKYADPGEDYDMWQQAFRMLGGFIDCDHSKEDGGSHDNNNGGGDEGGACSRWMMWASVS